MELLEQKVLRVHQEHLVLMERGGHLEGLENRFGELYSALLIQLCCQISVALYLQLVFKISLLV